MNPVKLIIFDCDGVLVESEILANRVYVEMLAEDGHTLPFEETLQEFHGVTLPNRILSTAKKYNWRPPTGFLPDFNRSLA